VLDSDDEALDSVTEQLGNERIVTLQANVALEADVRAAVAGAVSRFGHLDHCVTVAGVFSEADADPLEEVSLETFMHLLEVNLVGTFLVVRESLPYLRARAGSGVMVASTAAISGHGIGSGYTASKGGITALTRLLAVQYAPHGVRFNCVAPGATNTRMAAGRYVPGDAVTPSGAGKPVSRLGEPEDVAASILYLLSGDAGQITGQVISVDGGFVVGVNR
jgi:NAD(P)-dependent dehydrogenase (short-subunit alcohol dehydrogenase family)